MDTPKLKLGTLVTITQFFEPISTSNKYWSDDLRKHGEELQPNVFRMDRYVPAQTGITGIVTGYKRIVTKTVYKIRKYQAVEQDTGAEVTREFCDFVSSESEPVYVVQTSLTKKYFVKKEWIFGMKEA